MSSFIDVSVAGPLGPLEGVDVTTNPLSKPWGSEIRIRDSGWATTSNALVAIGDAVHYVWADGEIRYRRSLDRGATWSSAMRLTFTPGQSTMPALAKSGSTLYLTWMDDTGGVLELYCKRSTDGGTTWSPDVKLSNSAGVGRHWLAANGAVLHEVWFTGDPFGVTPNIYYKRSVDGGQTWGSSILIGGGGARPVVDVSGDIVHAAWSDNRDRGDKAQEVYYRRSPTAGLTWDPEIRITNNLWWSGRPRIAVLQPSEVFLVWDDGYFWDGKDYRDEDEELYFSRSTDSGKSWVSPKPLTAAPKTQTHAGINAVGSSLHIVWTDNRDGTWKPYYKGSRDGGLTWETDQLLSNVGGTWAESVVQVGSEVIASYNRDSSTWIRKRAV